MPATPMHIELLVIGFGVSIWFSFFLSWLFGSDWITGGLTGFRDYALLLSAFVLSITYAFGILMDKFSKFALEKIVGEEKAYYDKFAALLRGENELAIADLTYVRSKVRILHASVVNFPLITLFSLAFLWKNRRSLDHLPSSPGFIMVAILVVGFIFTVLSFRMYRYNTDLYQDRLDSIFEAGENPGG